MVIIFRIEVIHDELWSSGDIHVVVVTHLFLVMIRIEKIIVVNKGYTCAYGLPLSSCDQNRKYISPQLSSPNSKCHINMINPYIILTLTSAYFKLQTWPACVGGRHLIRWHCYFPMHILHTHCYGEKQHLKVLYGLRRILYVILGCTLPRQLRSVVSSTGHCQEYTVQSIECNVIRNIHIILHHWCISPQTVKY
jgi:hypothetical protein